jgi:RNA polymerase sigma factor (sigma-70 family)
MLRLTSTSAISSSSPQPLAAAEPEDARWFTEKIHPHERSLRSYIKGAFPAMQDVDDVLQESYLRVWKARAAHPIQSAKSFLFRVARNVALDWVRHRRASPIDCVDELSALDVGDDQRGEADAVCMNERIALLAAAIDTLPPRCREIVIFCKLQGRTYREAAAHFDLSEKTVAEHVYRGAQRLGQELSKRGFRDFSA